MKSLYFLLISNVFLSFFIHIHGAQPDSNLQKIRTAVLTNQPELLQQLLKSNVCFAGARKEDGFPILVGENFMSSTMTELLLKGQASALDQCPQPHFTTALQFIIYQTIEFKKTEDQDQLRRIELLVKDLKTRATPGEKALKDAKNYLNKMICGNGTEKSRIMEILSGKTNYSSILPITEKAAIETPTISPTPTPSIDEQNYRNGLEQETPRPTPPGTPKIIELNGTEETENYQFEPIERQNGVIDNDDDSDNDDEFTEINLDETKKAILATIKEEEEKNSKSSSWWPWK